VTTAFGKIHHLHHLLDPDVILHRRGRLGQDPGLLHADLADLLRTRVTLVHRRLDPDIRGAGPRILNLRRVTGTIVRSGRDTGRAIIQIDQWTTVVEAGLIAHLGRAIAIPPARQVVTATSRLIDIAQTTHEHDHLIGPITMTGGPAPEHDHPRGDIKMIRETGPAVLPPHERQRRGKNRSIRSLRYLWTRGYRSRQM